MVSIVIPFKNTEAFLEDCLDSICIQNYHNWEVLAVDDGSTDSSWQLVKNYSIKEPRIKIFKSKGDGIIPALQTAYNNASGKFVTRMDSDDIMLPIRLEYMVNKLEENGPGHIAVGLVKYFSNRGISDGYSRYEKWLNNLTQLGTNFSEIYKECVIPSPCWMVYRIDFEKCGGFEPQRYPEDYDLTFRFFENQLKIIPCNELLHYWRDYDNRTSRTHEHYAQNYFLDIKIDYFLKLSYNANRPLVVWGAGYKGKTIAKKLIALDIDFTWLCDNPKKIDKSIYNKKMNHFSMLESLNNPQSIVTVANEEAQQKIRAYLRELKQKEMTDYYFFC